MDDKFQGINVIAAVIAALVVGKMLAGRAWWVKWPTILVVAGAVGFGLAVYERRNNPDAAASAIEQQLLSLSPVIAVIKQDEPETWRAFIANVGQKDVAFGGNPSQEAIKQVQDDMRAMLKKFWRAVVMADDGAILAVGRQEAALDETLLRETITMCGSRGEPVWNINALPPESRKAFQRFLDMIVAAYHEGKGTQATIVDDEQGFQLAQAAITQQNSPMNTEDVKFLFSNDNSDLARRCRVRLQFENNVLSIPENVALLRWLYSKQ